MTVLVDSKRIPQPFVLLFFPPSIHVGVGILLKSVAAWPALVAMEASRRPVVTLLLKLLPPGPISSTPIVVGTSSSIWPLAITLALYGVCWVVLVESFQLASPFLFDFLFHFLGGQTGIVFEFHSHFQQMIFQPSLFIVKLNIFVSFFTSLGGDGVEPRRRLTCGVLFALTTLRGVADMRTICLNVTTRSCTSHR